VKFCYKLGDGGEGGAAKKTCDVLEVTFGDKLQKNLPRTYCVYV